MVRTDVLTGYEEHFLAYLVAGAIIAAAPRGSPPLGTGILLWLYAGVLELGQNFVPGRHPAIEDFAASALRPSYGDCIDDGAAGPSFAFALASNRRSVTSSRQATRSGAGRPC